MKNETGKESIDRINQLSVLVDILLSKNRLKSAEEVSRELVGIFYDQASYSKAEATATKALAFLSSNLGAEHPETCWASKTLIDIYYRTGRFNDAEQLASQTVAKLMGREGQHFTWADSISNLVRILQQQGRLHDVEEWITRLSELLEQYFDETDIIRLAHKCIIAYQRCLQGCWREAEGQTLELIAQCRMRFGLECFAAAQAFGLLGEIYTSQGKWDEANGFLDLAVTTARKIYGRSHPNLLHILFNQVRLYVEQGRWDEAETADSECREVAADLPLVGLMTISMYRAAIFEGRGNFDDAKELLEQVIQHLESEVCPQYLYLPEGKNILVGVLRSLSLLVESEELGCQTVELSNRIFGSHHPTSLRCVDNLARTWMAQGQVSKAVQAMEECVGSFESTIGPQHYLTQRSRTTLQEWREQVGFGGLIEQVDFGGLMEVDFGGLMEQVDFGGLMEQVDFGGLMEQEWSPTAAFP